jgi:hypothetical protein
MKIVAVSLFAIGLGLASMSVSQAMPVAPLDQAAVAGATTARPAGIPDRSAAVASATGELKNEGGGNFLLLLFSVI